jgi:hypothetical protein
VPTFDAVREAGAGDSLFTPTRSPPPSVAMRPRVAARSAMSGALWPVARSPMSGEAWPATQAHFARLVPERMTPFHTATPPGWQGTVRNQTAEQREFPASHA